MSTPTLEEIISPTTLPLLPPAAVRLLDALDDPAVDPSGIATLLTREDTLSRKLLQAANSGHFKLNEPCTTVDRAMMHLGLSTVRTLVLGFSLVDLTRKLGHGFDLLGFWSRCFYSAAAARRIAVLTRCCDPEEAFLAALMQDIGMMAIQTALGDRYTDIIARTGGNHRLLPHWERASLGFTHAEAGGSLGDHWGLPGQLVEPIRHHHRKVTNPNTYGPTVNTVVLASQIATMAATPDPKASFATVSTMSRELFGLSVDDTRSLVETAARDKRGLSGLLEMKTDEATTVVAEADEALISQQSEVQQQAASLASGDLRDELDDDDVSCALRQRFERDLAMYFERAQAGKTCLGLIFGEVDDYDALKKKLGSGEVENLMNAVADRIRRRTGATGQLCRLRDGRFAVIAPGASRIDAAQLAEHVRVDIEREPFDPHDAAVTVSLGVAVLDSAVAEHLVRSELLVQLSRNATLAARRAGRNCVRVFRARHKQT